MDELIGFCRACLVKYDDLVDLVNYSEKNRRLFAYCTGLQVKRSDMFTVQLCKGCFMLMKMSCVFKKQARTSDKKFKSYMGLKQEAAVADFCTFLKNTDKTFRLPLNGSSTPQEKPREEDNESTCTSIRNFITDMLRPEEIPETEAKIIDEVLDEEMNILDDSLDSHWFEDTMDQDFNIDFSLSPFTSPRLPSPRHPTPAREPPRYQFPDAEPYRPEPYRVEPYRPAPDAIDRNLEKALGRTTGEIALEDLLVSPVDSNIIPDTSRDNTMDVLDNILFGENIDSNSRQHTSESVKKIVNNEEEPNILDDFFKPKPEKPNFYIEYNDNSPKHESEEQKSTLDILMTIEKDKEAEVTCEPDIELYQSPVQLVKLEDIVHPKVETKCSVCEWQAKDFKSLKMHLSRKHSIRIVQEKMKSIKLAEVFDEKSNRCTICGKSASHMKAIKSHMRILHRLAIVEHRRPRNKVVCEVCGKSGIDTGNYKRHLATHRNTGVIYMCDYCKLEFSTKLALVQHILSHPAMQGARKHVTRPRRECGTCGALVADLPAHAARHAAARPHACAACDRVFLRRCERDQHVKSKHRRQVYPCRVCGATYKCFTSLSQHARFMHTDDELPEHKCHICAKVFLSRGSLAQHLKKSQSCSVHTSRELISVV